MPKANTSGLDSSEYYQPKISESDKLQLIRSRFEDINELDLQDGQSFFAELDGGI